MRPSRRLPLQFALRMVDALATNNVLRGSWAEQVVAHHLGVHEWPGNWCYYDLRDSIGRDISIKHSVGPRPRFSVAMSLWAWDAELCATDPATEGWRGGGPPSQYWCHAYVFAWLPSAHAAPPLDEVLDVDRWRFWVLSRADMHRAFAAGAQKTVSMARLVSLQGESVCGNELADLVECVPLDHVDDDVPPRRLDPYRIENVGPPVVASAPPMPADLAEPYTDSPMSRSTTGLQSQNKETTLPGASRRRFS